MTDTATENKSKREAIIRKVRALLAKTTENGAGEAEAMAAAEKAADLMRDYDLTFTDVKAEVEAEKFGAIRKPYAQGKTAHPVVAYCSIPTARYWDCKFARDAHGNLVFFGTYDDVQAAWNMLELLRTAADTEFAKFWQSPARPYGVKFNTARAGFMSGFVDRVCDRLKKMKAERSAAAPQGSTALVVVKDQVVSERFATFRQGERLSTSTATGGGKTRDGHSYRAGAAAGGAASIGGRSARLAETRKLGSA